jgi:tetratricopeptide (TPR) repeat protein
VSTIIDGNARGGAALTPRNPYIAGRALADARGFFGRTDIFRLVETVLSQSDQNAIVLFGQRRIGKTSVLLRLRHNLPSPPFRTVYFDLMDRARKPLGTVIYELAATMAEEFGVLQPTEGDFDSSADDFKDRFLPSLLQQLGPEARPVILFDEFDVLDVAAEENLPETAAARAFFPFLRGLMERERRLAFVFVVGRKAEDLSINVKATFKAARYQRISILDVESARQLVGLAEREGSLRFTSEAVDRLLTLTARHPYFTQLMCQLLFDQAYASNPAAAPIIDVDDVERVIPKTLEAGENIFEWVWDGLPPAERVIFSAVAEVTGTNDVITEEELTAVLQRHGIRILIRELELAPKTLIEWEMLRRVSGGYGFLVDLMRRWVALRKPLPKVKDELDRINPIADQQYHLGYTFYRLGKLAEAIPPLKAALQVNPNHLKARLLLGEALREQGLLEDSVKELEEAYRYDEDAARYTLVRALMVQGEGKEKAGREEEAVGAYERILAISPRESLARERWRALVVAKGDRALKKGDYDGALKAYQAAGAEAQIASVLGAQRTRALKKFSSEIGQLLEREEWDKAGEQYRRLIELDPLNVRWAEELAKVERHAAIARRYAEGLGALQQYKLTDAQRAFADVVGLRPDYKDAAVRLASVVQRVRDAAASVGGQDSVVSAAPEHTAFESPFASPRAMRLLSLGVLAAAIGFLAASLNEAFGMASLSTAIAAALSLVIARARKRAPAMHRNWIAAALFVATLGHLIHSLFPFGEPIWVGPQNPRSLLAVVSYGCLIAAFTERRHIRVSPVLPVIAAIAWQAVWQSTYFYFGGGWSAWLTIVVGALGWLAWIGLERWQSSRTPASAYAAWGATLPLLSMFLTVLEPLNALAGMTALWLIAVSVWAYVPTESASEDSQSISVR